MQLCAGSSPAHCLKTFRLTKGLNVPAGDSAVYVEGWTPS